LVLPDADQTPGAEPGFDGDSPQGGQTSVIMLPRSSDHPFKVLEKQKENDLTLAQGPTQSLGVVVEDGAGGAAF